ncbi:glycosyltransferase, family 1 [Campylobacter mucosalis]|uniref:glycosyltransferase n=1 Tax=Campylobacter mucosalis TaxID=202 RepID=UPI000B0F7205|nr:glycosyltransferase [Campylobacter mucosalis]QKF62458.1 glycosyltransferase, family 1 [Campylobacter mucosalis]
MIKVIHTEWSDGWGGQEIRTISESLALKEKYGVNIIIACRSNAKIATKAKEAGLDVVFFDFKGAFDVKSIFALAKFIKQNNINILNSHSGKDTWIGGLAAKIAGIKFIRTRHLSNAISSSRLNFINELADFIITTGENVKDAMIKNNRINPQKILSIPTGVDDTKFRSELYDKNESLKKFGLENGKIYIGMLSVLRAIKRHDIFLKIALNLHEKYPNALFVIVGSGPQEQNIRDFIKNNNMQEYVKMLGHQENTAMFLKAIDIYMMISENEGVPQSLMQALLMQKASIATNVGSVSNLYDGKNFKLVDFDEIKIQNELENLLQNSNEREILEQNAREFVKNNFTKDIMAKKIYQIYTNLLKAK